MHASVSSSTLPDGSHYVVETIGVWIVDVVVDTGSILETSWLPELGLICSSVVVVEEELRDEGDTE